MSPSIFRTALSLFRRSPDPREVARKAALERAALASPGAFREPVSAELEVIDWMASTPVPPARRPSWLPEEPRIRRPRTVARPARFSEPSPTLLFGAAGLAASATLLVLFSTH